MTTTTYWPCHRSPLTSERRSGCDDVAGDSADDLRLAFTCDNEVRVVRLALVAFALDGAKDAVREAGWCGPRDVRIVTDVGDPGPRFLGYSFHAEETFALKCSRVALTAASCVVDPVGVLVNANTMPVLRRALEVEAPPPVRRVRLHVDCDDAVVLATTVLERLSASVERLLVTLAADVGRCQGHVAAWLTSVRRCSRLTSFTIEAAPPADPQIAIAVCHAVAASGAPVTEVSIGAGVIDLSATAGPLSRLRELKRVRVFNMSDGSDVESQVDDAILPPLKPQLTHLIGFWEMGTMKQLECPSLERRCVKWLELSEGSLPQLAACLGSTRILELSLGRNSRAFPHDATLATLCPRMERLMLSEFEPVDRLWLPPQLPTSLTALTVLGAPGYAPWAKRRDCRHRSDRRFAIW